MTNDEADKLGHARQFTKDEQMTVLKQYVEHYKAEAEALKAELDREKKDYLADTAHYKALAVRRREYIATLEPRLASLRLEVFRARTAAKVALDLIDTYGTRVDLHHVTEALRPVLAEDE